MHVRTTRFLALLAVAALAAMAVPTVANHAQTVTTGAGTFGVTFDHDGDNEWWVEVLVKGTDGDHAVTVEARPEGGTYKHLQHKANVNGWTKWGTNTQDQFRIPTGQRVQFRATVLDGATGNTQAVESCLFTHPAGVEQCAAAPPLWPTTIVGDAGSGAAGGGDMALGDADNDGRRDVTIGNAAGIYTFEKSGTTWTRQLVSTTEADALAVGDGDGDGTREVYAAMNGTLVQARSTDGVWSTRAVLTLPQNPNSGPSSGTTSGDMTIGNIDGVAGPELYVAIGHVDCDPEGFSGCFTSSYVFHVAFASGTWRATEVSTSGGNIRSMWIGDGDSDGDSELYVGRTSRHAEGKTQVERVHGVWQTTDLPGWSGTGNQLVVGDVDRDGRREVYTASFTGEIGLISFSPTTGEWTHRVIATVPGAEPRSLFIGDADNDGRQDLYVGKGDGEVVQVRFDAGQWKQAVVARITDSTRGTGDVGLVIVGDGDGDARSEVYAGVLFGWASGDLLTRVYRIGEPLSTGFDATFTGVRGNEWWQQVSVSASGGTLSDVDIRLNGGAWQPMTKQSYGWTKSLRAVQGTIVQFKATSTTGATDLSDCYRWIPPANTDATKVACGTTTTTSTTSTTGSAFDATFSGVKGNDWWVQASVSANQPLAGVDARVNCSGAWHPLTKQSYGWSASFNVPAGSKVDFRARSTSGATDLSAGYVWPQATPAGAC